jgi:hypothetical protein
MALKTVLAKPKLLIVILTVTALALGVSTMAAITVNQNVSSTGTITTTPNIAVYSDSGCTTSLTSINWGSVAAGESATRTVYVKNTGTGAMTLGLSASSWSPSGAGTYITVSWNKGGTSLAAGESTAAIITLSVSSSITGISSFSNTITISGTG